MRHKVEIAHGHKWVGLAKKKVRQLEAQRRRLRLPFMKKVIYVGDAYIMAFTSERDQWYYIFGGGDAPLIMLHNGEDFNTYDVYTDTLARVAGYTGIGEVLPIYNTRVQLEELYRLTYAQAWFGAPITAGLPGDFLGGANDYEMAFFSDGDSVHARVGDISGQVATLESPDVLVPEFCGGHGSLFGLSLYTPTVAAWNLYNGMGRYALSPNTASLTDAWKWIPSFFTAEPNDAYNLAPGFYYGKYPFSDYGIEQALQSLDVSLVAVMDTRYDSGTFTHGWAEVVTNVNGTPTGDIYIYIGDTGIPQNVTTYRELGIVLASDSTVTIGCELGGYEPVLQISSTELGVKPDKAELWNFPSFGTDEAVGFIVVEGTRCRGYKYTGATTNFIDTDSYHSHAISTDGSLVAIFEGSGLIENVKVYDLKGTRDPVRDSAYTLGGITLLRDSATVATSLSSTGCIIPYRQESFTLLDPSFTLDGAVIESTRPSDYLDYMPSLAIMSFGISGELGITIKKIVCSNGVDASYGISGDECFAGSSVTVDDPDEGIPLEKLISSWDAGGIFRGVVNGIFTGEHPNMKFNGTGTGSSGWYGTIGLPDEFYIISDVYGRLTFEGVAGDVIPGDCIVEDETYGYIADQDCVDNCNGEPYTMTASTTCGQSASRIVEGAGEADPLVITGPTAAVSDDWFVGKESEPPGVSVGEFITSSGGRGTKTYSATGITVNSVTGEILNLNGVCDATVTVEDACGDSATASVVVSGGSWVAVSTENHYAGNCYAPTSGLYIGCPADSGTNTYFCYDTPDELPYYPFQTPFEYIPCSEIPFGTDWVCDIPCSTGCYPNNFGTWVWQRSNTTKEILLYGTFFCPGGTGYIYVANIITSYVWECA